MKKIIYIMILVSASLSAQTDGKAGLSFLELGFGARNSALADLGVVMSSGVSAQAYNPAILTEAANSQLLFNYQTLLFDVNNQMAGCNFNIGSFPVAVMIQTTSINDIEIRLVPGDPIAKFNAHYFMAGISSAYKIFKNLSAGISIKYIYEDMFTDNANGTGIDLGLYYSNLFSGFNIGASVKNLGSMNALRYESTPLPTNIRFGAAYNFSAPSLYSDIQIAGGYIRYTSTTDDHFQIAGEIVIKKTLSLRCGYVTGFDSRKLSAGAGIKWGSFNFDYAIVPYQYDLGNSSTITVSYDF